MMHALTCPPFPSKESVHRERNLHRFHTGLDRLQSMKLVLHLMSLMSLVMISQTTIHPGPEVGQRFTKVCYDATKDHMFVDRMCEREFIPGKEPEDFFGILVAKLIDGTTGQQEIELTLLTATTDVVVFVSIRSEGMSERIEGASERPGQSTGGWNCRFSGSSQDYTRVSWVCPTRNGSVDLLQLNVTVTMEKRAKSGSGSNALPAAPGELLETATTEFSEQIFPIFTGYEFGLIDNGTMTYPPDLTAPGPDEGGGEEGSRWLGWLGVVLGLLLFTAILAGVSYLIRRRENRGRASY